MSLTARDLEGLGIIDGILPEPLGGAHRDPPAAARVLKQALLGHLDALSAVSAEQRAERRLLKFRNMGVYREGQP
jgi:acetyl-CoA carboxylase carboxyl transferase subunit alpha